MTLLQTIRRAGVVLAAVTCVVTLTSCCAPKRLTPWTPNPSVQWDHVSVPQVEPVWNGYRILIPQPTHGLFPAAMGVTRVAVKFNEDEPGMTRPYLYTDPRNEFLQWNRALDDQMAVSEVFPIVERDLGGGPATPEQILAAAHALHARLGLIYAVNELSRSETELFGVLYDTATTRPIASVHAQAYSIPRPEGEDDPESIDLWETDSRALARERFDRLVHACIRDLILHDERDATEAPEGWTPAGPIQPVEWPPRHFRTGR